ncbi:carbohydrate binding domain-containing protein, partial [Streptomyces griseus]
MLAAGTLAVPVGAAQPLDEAPELIVNGDFSAGTAPWWSTANSPIAVSDGRLCADVPAGTANAWDAIVGQNALALAVGESYTLSYSATSTVPVTIHTNVQMANEPWTTELATAQQVGTAVEHVTETFTAGADHDAAQLAFQIGGSAEPFTFCVDDVSL